MTAATHPREALFEEGERAVELPVCDHYCGTEERMLKSLALQARLGPVFDVTLDCEDGAPVVAHLLSLTPFRRIVKDYFMICDSYYQAIRTATTDKIEAIDMGRRGIHDEGSRTLQERLKGKVRIDFETSRRLFTLICVLHWKGQDA